MERTLYKTPRNEHGLPNIVIPAEILFHESLTPNERILFGIINNLAYNQNGYCWASNRYLARILQIKQQTSVSTMLSKLQKENFIKMEYETRYDGKQVRKIFVDKTYPMRYSKSLQQAFKNLQKPIINKITPLRVNHKGGYGNKEGGLCKSIGNIDIDIDSIDNTKVLSCDLTAPTGPADPPEPQVHPDVEKVLSYWFSLPNTVQHKQSSKAYNNAIQVIDNLLNGLPIQHTKDGHPYKPLQAFCSKHRIDPELLSRKWRVNQIKKILRSIHKHMAGETGNGVKGNIPLDMVFWNSHANNGGWSWFLFKASESSVPEQFQGMAAKLAQAIGQDLPEGKMLSWAKDLQLFCNTNPADEVDKVLDWYMPNIDWQYVKSVTSCKDFCQFYKNIKKSMYSWYNDNKGSAKKQSRSKIGTRNMECHDKEVVFSTGEIYKGEKE